MSATLLCVVIALSVALATVLVFKEVTEQATITSSANLKIMENPSGIEITSYNFGTFVNQSSPKASKDMTVKNIGNTPLWVSWTITTSGWTVMSVDYYQSASGIWMTSIKYSNGTYFLPNTYGIMLNPNENFNCTQWVECVQSNPLAGTETFTLRFNGASSSSG